ncbi:MAG: S41 family peptidase [Planctomycetota bacterium]|nr:MAG: S41 family peptidase [Planctomycetota bacterium]
MTERSPSPTRLLLTAVVAVLAAVVVFAVHDGPVVARRAPQPTVHDVQRLIEKYYVREVDPDRLTEAALRGMTEALDPYSSYLSPEEAKAFRDDTEGEFGGVGIEITIEEGLVRVIAPVEGSPAFEAGVLPGDRIIEIDGVAHEFRSVEQAAKILKGPPGSRVVLTVVHEGANEPVELTIERAIIHVPSVSPPEIVDPARRIGYVRVAQFSPETGRELREAVATLVRAGARGLVLDLRSNPGGHLEAALACADLFVADGVLLRTEGRTEHRTRVAHREGTNTDLVLAVLVNGYSASAAEIVAGALQDAGRAVVVGTRTFGKGSVQQLIPLGPPGHEALLRLTTALWHTRSGRPIHRPPGAGSDEPWGIRPDVEVELDPARLQRIFRAQAVERFRHAGAKEPIVRTAATGDDPQLEAAVRSIRERLDSASAAKSEGGNEATDGEAPR